jgi:hypothetical protein
MTRTIRCATAAAIGWGVLAASAAAQTAAAPLDTGALAELDRMGTYLRSLPAFQVRAVLTSEDVLDDGQKVQYASDAEIVVRRPDRLRASLTSERAERQLLYDGRQFTYFAPRLGYYATAGAPASVTQLVDLVEERYGIDVPLVDLFRWGVRDANPAAIRGALDLGPSEVAGVTCRHYAFRQEGLDWQVWIQRGEFPLPRKLVITTTSDEARPQHTAVYSWNLAPSMNESAFRFEPPPGARRIVFAADGAATR